MARPEQSRAEQRQPAARDEATTLGWDGVEREVEWRVVGAVYSTIIAFAVGGLPQASGELPKKVRKK